MSRYVVRLNGTTINVPEIDDVEEYRLVNYDTEKKDYALIEPKLSMEFGQAGSLEFTMSPNHPLYYGVFDGALWNELTEAAKTPEYKRRLKAAKQLVKNQKNMITAKGLGFYKYDITHYRVPTKFGNIDMDDRYIVKWTKTRKKRYAAQLATWDYEPSTGDIDTVYGGSARFMVGTTGLPDGVEVAYSAIFQKPNGAGFRFMGKDVLYTYINQLIANTVAAGGGVFSESKMLELDQVGLKIGEYPLKNMIAAADVGTRYDNFYNIADVYGRLMEFCGYYGTIQRLRRDVTAIEEELTSGFGNMEDQLSWTRGLVIVEEDDDIIFAGRLYSYEIDMFKRKHMVFEGALSFFHDSIQPPAEYDGVYMTDFIEALLTNHNNQVTENRKILPGYLGMANRQSIYRKTDYEDTWTCLQNYVIDTIGGYFVVRCEKMFADPEDADHYLLYLDYYNRSTVVYNGILGVSSEYTLNMYNEQVIEFQQNLLDISESFSMDDIFTQLIPLGQTEVKGEEVADDDRPDEELTLDSEWRSKYGVILVDSVPIYASSDMSSQVVGTLVKSERFEFISTDIVFGALEYIGEESFHGPYYNVRSIDGSIEGYIRYYAHENISEPTGHISTLEVYGADDWQVATYVPSSNVLSLRYRDGHVLREGPGKNFNRAKTKGLIVMDILNATYNDSGQLWFYGFQDVVYINDSNHEQVREEFFVHESGLYLPNDEVLSRYVPGYNGRKSHKLSKKQSIPMNDGATDQVHSIDNRWRASYGMVIERPWQSRINSAPVYARPSRSSNVVGNLSRGTNCKYVGTADIVYDESGPGAGIYFHISGGGVTGYIEMNNFSYPYVESRHIYGSENWTDCTYYPGEGLYLTVKNGAVIRKKAGSNAATVNLGYNVWEGDGALPDRAEYVNGDLWFKCKGYNTNRNQVTYYISASDVYLPNDAVLKHYIAGFKDSGRDYAKDLPMAGTVSSGGEYSTSVPEFTSSYPGELDHIDNRLTIAEINGGSVILTIKEAQSFEEQYMENTGTLINGDPIFISASATAATNKKKKKQVLVNTDNLNNELYFSPSSNSFAERFGNITKVKVFNNITDVYELKRKACEYLLEHARSAIEVSVSSVDLSMVDTDFSKFKIGQFVPVKYSGWSSRFSWDASPIWTQDGSLLRILKMEIKMDTGEKNISVGTQKKKDLTEIVKEVNDEAKRKGIKASVVTSDAYDKMEFHDPDEILFVAGDS